MMRIDVQNLAIPDIKLIRAGRAWDERGFFSETYSQNAFKAAGIDFHFVQDNHSASAGTGVIRGLHFQTEPYGQDKLVRVTRGSILDVAVDLRRGSPWFGRHVAVVLSEAEWAQLLVPIGFAHGFMALEPDTHVLYKVTAHYAPAHDRGLLWNDPDLGIDWPLPPTGAILSDKDRQHPRLRDLDPGFSYRATGGRQ